MTTEITKLEDIIRYDPYADIRFDRELGRSIALELASLSHPVYLSIGVPLYVTAAYGTKSIAPEDDRLIMIGCLFGRDWYYDAR